MKIILRALIFFVSIHLSIGQSDPNHPNVILIIADDMGIDPMNGYNIGTRKAITPHLDSLRSVGITYDNAWAYSKCTPSRAAIMTGKYGAKTGVVGTPGDVKLSDTSIFHQINNKTNSLYTSAQIGKWHITHPPRNDDPGNYGVDYFSGVMNSGVTSYTNWAGVEQGVSFNDTNYVTSVFTDKANSWIKGQNSPFFLWLAHVAPHTPVHDPPAFMISNQQPSTPKGRYLSMIESMDYEIGRLLDSIPKNVKDNTLFIFIGDNGTPANLMTGFPTGKGKSTLYEGGVRVPLLVAGKGVTRKNVRDTNMVHCVDLYATILKYIGAIPDNGIYNSLDFGYTFTNTIAPQRTIQYAELVDRNILNGYTISNGTYKFIDYSDTINVDEFFHIKSDTLETNNLLNAPLTPDLQNILDELKKEALAIQNDFSCNDKIKNGSETGIDCGGNCSACAVSVISQPSNTDILLYPNPAKNIITLPEKGDYTISSVNGTMLIKGTKKTNYISISNIPEGKYILQISSKSYRFTKSNLQ